MSQFETRRIADPQRVMDLSTEWIDLWQRCRSATTFQRPEWLIPWIETYTPHRVCFVECRDNGRLVGLAPMFIYARGQERVLAPVGAGITDYLDWLIDPAAQSCLPQLFEELHKENWDIMELLDLPGNSPLLSGGTPGDRQPCDVCPTLHIPPGTAFNAIVPRRQRRNLRTAQNRSSRNASWKIEVANSDTLPEFLNTLIRLHTRRWRELREPGVLADPKVQEFHRRSVSRLLRSGLLRFYGLRFEGRLIGVLHTLIGPGAVYCYMQGFDPAYVEFSPGMLVLEAVIHDAIRDCRPRVDFLRGREKYKYGWGAQDAPTFQIRVRKSAQTDIAHRAA